MKSKITICLFLLLCCFCNIVFADYDVTIEGVHRFENVVSYSNNTILVTDDAFVIYDSNLVLENCTMDVDGAVDCKDINLINSVINVKGNFKTQPGAIITETGASSIITTGDAQNIGRTNLEGELYNPITIISDYIQNDKEFIIIDANSSSNSSLKFINFYGGWCNVWIKDKRLNEAISNCCFFGADYGVWEDGKDGLTDIRFSLFENYLTPIFLGIEPTTESNVEVWVDNVVINSNFFWDSYGCVVFGSSNPNLYGSFKMTNSIITNTFCGWYLDTNTYVLADFSNIAYYNNYRDDNLEDSSGIQTNPMYLFESPFEVPEFQDDWLYFIRQDSPVADVNLGYDLWQIAPQQLVTSLFKNSFPRTNKGIGFGVPISPEYNSNVYDIQGDFDDNGIVNFFDYTTFALEWGSEKNANYSVADFNRDRLVNLLDLEILSSNWLSTTADSNHGDVNKDGVVNNFDFSLLAEEWGSKKGSLVHFPDANGYSIADFDYDGIVGIYDLATFSSNWLVSSRVELTIQDDISSVNVTCQHPEGLAVNNYAIFLDGKYIASREPNDNPSLIIDKMKYSKGTHALKAVFRTTDNLQYVTLNKMISFDSLLHDLSFVELFDASNNYTITGKADEGYVVNIAIKDFDENVLWANSYTGAFQDSINPQIFSAGTVDYKITYTCSPAIPKGMLLSSLDSASGLDSSSGEAFILALDGPPSYETAGLVLCMLYDGMTQGTNEFNTGTCRFAAKMMESKGVIPIILRGYGEYNHVNVDMFRNVFNKFREIRYMHVYAHGNNESDGAGILGLDVLRTRLKFNDGDWPAYNSRMWTDKRLPVPENYTWLSDELEQHYCLGQFPLVWGQLRILVIESCYALRNVATIDSNGVVHYVEWAYDYEIRNHINSHPAYPYSDLCFAFNILNNRQMALGSGDRVIKGGLYPYYVRFFNTFWRCLGDGNSAQSALSSAISIASYDVLTYFRLRGAGDMSQIYLNNNP